MSCNRTGISLEVEGLSYGTIGREAIISDISFAINAGDRLVIFGPNGAGKTTLLRCLYRGLKPTKGRIMLAERDLCTIAPRDAAKTIAVVLQEQPGSFPYTVEDIVLMGRIPWSGGLKDRLRANRSDDRDKAAHAIDHLRLGALAKRSYATLSGGEKQRVLVARALAQDPQILFLDEPSNHLDIRNQLEILDLLAELKITVVATLHDINLANGFANKAAVLKAGHLLSFGCPEEVLTPEILTMAFDVETASFRHRPDLPAHFTFSLPA